MSKAQQKKTKKPVESESESESNSDNQNDNDEQLLVGAGDELGAFDDTQFQENEKDKKKKTHNIVHLHFQQRTTRKCLTLVQGLPDDLDLKKILRQFKKAWCCNGTTHEHAEWGTIIQLQGDHRRDIHKFLTEEGICLKDEIKVHGY